jgi:hypothetical protein
MTARFGKGFPMLLFRHNFIGPEESVKIFERSRMPVVKVIGLVCA